MINALILTMTSLIGSDGYETIPVITPPASEIVLACNGYGCRSGGCSSGGCSSGGCSSGNCSPGYFRPSYSYSRPSYVQTSPVYTLPTLNLIIDIPTNQQLNRFYVKSKVNGRMYNIPVINGIIPTIHSRHENELVLTYATGRQFHPSMFGSLDYINYSSGNTNTTVSALKTFGNNNRTTEPTASALKHPDAMPKETPFNFDQMIKTPLAPKRVMSDDTLDNFLNKPSSIGESNRVFPRY